MKRSELEGLRARKEVYDAVLDALWDVKLRFQDDEVQFKQMRAIIRTIEVQFKMVEMAIYNRERE